MQAGQEKHTGIPHGVGPLLAGSSSIRRSEAQRAAVGAAARAAQRGCAIDRGCLAELETSELGMCWIPHHVRFSNQDQMP